jgi:hypothetical protein
LPLLLLTLFLPSLVTVFACSGPNPPAKLKVEKDDEGDGDIQSTRDGGRRGVPPGADEPLPDGGKPPGRIYAHSGSVLYRFDPLANTLVQVGPFSCVPRDESETPGSLENDAVIDLAVDKTGQMYATTFWRFIKVDPTSGSCNVIRTDPQVNQYPNSLSFVPRGAQEVLVGYVFDNLDDATIFTEIDLETGTMTDKQNLNPVPPLGGVEYGISGDVISLVRTNGKTYAAIKQVTGDVGAGNDQLAEIDPETGTIKAIIGDTGQQGFFGMGFWAGKAYGFTSVGSIYEVDVTNGASKLVLEGKDPNGLSVEWFGAGVTTDAPTAP